MISTWKHNNNKKFYYRYLKLKVLKQQQILVNKIHKYRPSPHQETTDHGYVLIIHNFTKEKNGLIFSCSRKKKKPLGSDQRLIISIIDYLQFYVTITIVITYYVFVKKLFRDFLILEAFVTIFILSCQIMRKKLQLQTPLYPNGPKFWWFKRFLVCQFFFNEGFVFLLFLVKKTALSAIILQIGIIDWNFGWFFQVQIRLPILKISSNRHPILTKQKKRLQQI